jgi:hypothetical protein
MSKKTKWPIILSTIILIYVGSMIGLVIYTSTTPPKLVTENYYQKGLTYQSQIDKENRTLKHELQPEIILVQNRLNIQFSDSLKFPIDEGTIDFYRPSDPNLDKSLGMDLDGSMKQTVNLAGFVKGKWKLRLEWKYDGKSYMLKKELFLE